MAWAHDGVVDVDLVRVDASTRLELRRLGHCTRARTRRPSCVEAHPAILKTPSQQPCQGVVPVDSAPTKTTARCEAGAYSGGEQCQWPARSARTWVAATVTARRAGSKGRWSQPSRSASGRPYSSLLTTRSTGSSMTAVTAARISATCAVQTVDLHVSRDIATDAGDLDIAVPGVLRPQPGDPVGEANALLSRGHDHDRDAIGVGGRVAYQGMVTSVGG